jgi:hypothetical protein
MARLQTSSFNEFSSSVNQRIINATNEQNLSNLATTGSNTFIGNQKITGSVSILIPGGTATGMNENPTPNNVFWSYPSQDTNTANVATGWTAQVVGGGTYTVTNVQVDTPFAPFIAITLSDPSLTLSYRSRINFSKTSKLWEFNSNGTLTGLPDGLVSGSSQISTFGFISSSQTINTASFATTGSNTFTGTTTFSGSVIIGPIGGDEGGEISLALAQTGTTLTGSAVVLDVYQDRLRIFENSGSFRGAHIDMTKLPSGVAGELIWKTSGFVNAGTFLTLDNLKVSVTTGGSRGLSVGAVSTNFTANISGWFGYTGGGGGASAVNIGYTTTGSSSAFGWSFGTEGDGSNYIINDKTNNRVYRVTLMIGNGYNNNFISIERLY